MALINAAGGGGVGVRGAFPLRRHRAAGLAARLAAPPVPATGFMGPPPVLPSVATPDAQMQQVQLARDQMMAAQPGQPADPSLVGVPQPLPRRSVGFLGPPAEAGLQGIAIQPPRRRLGLGLPPGAPARAARPGIASSLQRRPRRYDMGGFGY